jgi:hypothetical protein
MMTPFYCPRDFDAEASLWPWIWLIGIKLVSEEGHFKTSNGQQIVGSL